MLANIRSKLPIGKTARPVHPRLSDVYIVEFPKSGITWLSMLLANTSLLASNCDERATFGSINQHVPDLHMNPDFGDLAYSRPGVRFIKSHSEFDPTYLMVLYLVRHPLAVMKSYFNFARAFEGEQTDDFDVFVRSDRKGVDAWRRHVGSWLGKDTGPARIMTIRYEDLLADCAAQIRRTSDTFGWQFTDAHIDEAVGLCSVEHMKSSEESLRSMKLSDDAVFVKSGFAHTIREETEAFILESCKDELLALGYE